jgi:hypothetical protein
MRFYPDIDHIHTYAERFLRMRCAEIFIDLRSLSLHRPANPSEVMLWCLQLNL